LTASLLYSLLRGADVTNLRIRDVDLDAGYVTAYVSKSKIWDRLPISAEWDHELRRWLTAYTREVGELKPAYFLFPGRRSAPLYCHDTHRIVGATAKLSPETQQGAIARVINPVLDDIGFDTSAGGEGGHTIRRSGARALFDSLSEEHHPRPLRVVKDMLHHASESMTEKYIGVEADRLDRDHVLRGRNMYANVVDRVVRLAQAE
jgi:integrase